MPSVTYWSRLEPRVRSDDIERSLAAEIRDPLWMLVRQWQFGEFRGEDAGSPIQAQMTVESRPLTHYVNRQGRVSRVELDLPLETRVERELVPIDARTRVQSGLHFARLLRREGAAGTLPAFLAAFPISTAGKSLEGIIDEATQRFVLGVAGRVVDGGALLEALRRGVDLADPRLPDGNPLPPELRIAANRADAVRRAAEGLHAWFRATYSQPETARDSAWSPPHLEYQFGVSVGNPEAGGTVMNAREYSEGHLDWYAFNGAAPAPDGHPQRETVKVIPSQVGFRGMPASRWWEFEEKVADFGSTDVHTTDLGRLLLVEFALIHGDDWFVIPCDAPIGSVVRVASLIVTDVFGQHLLVQGAGRGPGREWQRSKAFSVASGSVEPFLFLPPTLGQMFEGPAIEEVVFMRDEMANMAWGVETTLPNGLGEPVAAFDAYQRSERAADGSGTPQPASPDGMVRFRLATNVAENWIPFVPEHTGEDQRSIVLVKAALLSNRDQREVPARGRILNPGDEPYRVNDEEIPRAARRVSMSFQWARWTDGSTHLWLGRRKRAGRGEGSSGLRFDILV